MNSLRSSTLARACAVGLVVSLVAVLLWAAVIAWRIERQAAFYGWLRTSGARVTAQVTELGETRTDGGALAVWVKNPGGTNCRVDSLFVDLSRSPERVTRPAQTLAAAVSCAADSPLENGPDGVEIGALGHNFGSGYAVSLGVRNGVVGPAILAALALSGLAVTRRALTGAPAGPPVDSRSEQTNQK